MKNGILFLTLLTSLASNAMGPCNEDQMKAAEGTCEGITSALGMPSLGVSSCNTTEGGIEIKCNGLDSPIKVTSKYFAKSIDKKKANLKNNY